MTQTPPESAVILFDGTDLSNWTSLDGSTPGWQVEGDAMLVVPRSGDVISKETFLDHFVHVEFRCPDMPEATGQQKATAVYSCKADMKSKSWIPTALKSPEWVTAAQFTTSSHPSSTLANHRLSGRLTMSSSEHPVSTTQVRRLKVHA